VVIYIQIFYEKYVHWLVGGPRESILLLSIRNMKLLTKVEETVPVKQLNEEFRLSTPPYMNFVT
jgi:hypothetical protein